jgi:hypothetical protein
MPCTTVANIIPATQDANFKFGYGSGDSTVEQGILVTGAKVVNKIDKKELMGSCGTVIAIHYYNRSSEVELSGYGKATCKVGTKISLTAGNLAQTPMQIASMIVDEVSYEETNDDFNKSTIKLTCYEDLTA